MKTYEILFHIDYEEEIRANNEKEAIEEIYSNYQGKYGFISIDKVKKDKK